MKKVISIFLTVIMLFGAVPIIASADAVYTDYVPGTMPANLMQQATNTAMLDTGDGTVFLATEADNKYSIKGDRVSYGYNNPAFAVHGAKVVKVTNDTDAGIQVSKLSGGKTYAVRLRVRTASGTPIFGVGWANDWVATATNEYGTSGYTPSSEWEWYNATITAPAALGTSQNIIGVGLLTTSGGGDEKVIIDFDEGFYFAEEAAYDINVSAQTSTEVAVGGNITLSASILNQVGLKGKLPQNNINWFVTDEEREQKINTGFAFSPSGDNTILTVSTDVAPGNYVLFAENANNTEMRKGIPFKVKMRDYTPTPPGAAGTAYDIKVTSSNVKPTLNALDTITINAEIVDNTDSTENLSQQFDWFALNENKSDTATKITLTPSTDTKNVGVEFDLNIADGTYYIFARSTSNKTMQRGYKIVTDDSDLVETIVNYLNGLTDASQFDNTLFGKYITILNLNDGTLDDIDMGELARLISLKNDFTIATVVDDIKSLAALSILNSNPNNVDVCDTDKDFLRQHELGIDTIDSNGATLYSNVYTNIASEDGKNAIISALKGKSFNNINEFCQSMKNAIVLNALQYPSVNGTGYVGDVLTEQNLTAAGINGGNYVSSSNKSQYNTDIAGKSFTVETLEEALAKEYTSTDSGVSNNSYNYGGGSSSGGGSGYSSSSHKVTTPSEPVKPINEVSFKDIDEKHWAFPEIVFLNKIGVINGAGDGFFYPENPVTREEIVKMICVALDIEPGGDNDFIDVDKSAWYYGYISAAKQNGIVSGISDTEFGVGIPVTRQDICVMVSRAIGNTSELDNIITFDDTDEIADYAIDAVNYLSTLCIINGFEDNTFRANDYCTRAQAAKIISNVLHIVD